VLSADRVAVAMGINISKNLGASRLLFLRASTRGASTGAACLKKLKQHTTLRTPTAP
jgi:hypothetical protein